MATNAVEVRYSLDIVRLKDNTTIITDWSDRDILDIISENCGNDYAKLLLQHFKDIVAELEEHAMIKEQESQGMELDLDILAASLREIGYFIDDYLSGLKSGREKFSRKSVLELFDKIKHEIYINT